MVFLAVRCFYEKLLHYALLQIQLCAVTKKYERTQRASSHTVSEFGFVLVQLLIA